MTKYEWMLEQLQSAGMIEVVAKGYASAARRPMEAVSLPLSAGCVGQLLVPRPMTAVEYDRMMHALHVMRDGLVDSGTTVGQEEPAE